MMSCFWRNPPAHSTSDCVPLVSMLNLKTANLAGLAWTNPPSPAPSIADPAGDLGIATLFPGGHTLAADGPPIVLRVPLRSVGGSFLIGPDSYARPPVLPSGQSVWLYVTMRLAGKFPILDGTLGTDTGFGWYGVMVPPAPNGYVRGDLEIVDADGIAVQAQTWCNWQARTGGGHVAGPNGVFPAGTSQGLGSYLQYDVLRMVAFITLPTNDFEGGEVRVSVSAPTTYQGTRGAPIVTTMFGAAKQVVFKLLATSSPSLGDDWDL